MVRMQPFARGDKIEVRGFPSRGIQSLGVRTGSWRLGPVSAMSLSSSYPNLINKKSAISVNSFSCSDQPQQGLVRRRPNRHQCGPLHNWQGLAIPDFYGGYRHAENLNTGLLWRVPSRRKLHSGIKLINFNEL